MTLPDPADPVALAAALIRCPSVTPAEAGAQSLLGEVLRAEGFAVTPLPCNGIANLYARHGTAGPLLCFAGHTDVVPPGPAGWTHPPFAGTVEDGMLHGRGAADMKGGVAAFTAAAVRRARAGGPGSIALLITGDEEGDAADGTVRVVQWMREHDQVPRFCLVGEPTNPGRLGEMIKIGRRGSLNATLTVRGIQGHSAYPQRADNPVHRLTRILAALLAEPLDQGTERFEPSSLQITSIDVGNPATNVIPPAAAAKLNIRFNDRHSGAALERWLRDIVGPLAPDHTLALHVSGEPFLTEAGPAVHMLEAAIEAETGLVPARDTGGGTSDARFIAPLCPVAEFGLVGATMHKTDEQVAVADLLALTRIYEHFIAAFLAEPAVSGDAGSMIPVSA